jgi:GH18 family chitinase
VLLLVEGSTAQHGPFALNQGSRQLVGFDDVDSVRQKAEYVKAQGLAGVSLSTLDLDDFNNLCCQVRQIIVYFCNQIDVKMIQRKKITFKHLFPMLSV